MRCEQCDYSSSRRWSLNRHIRLVHQSPQKYSDREIVERIAALLEHRRQPRSKKDELDEPKQPLHSRPKLEFKCVNDDSN